MKYYSEVLNWDLWETYWRMMNKQENCIKVCIRIIEKILQINTVKK